MMDTLSFLQNLDEQEYPEYLENECTDNMKIRNYSSKKKGGGIFKRIEKIDFEKLPNTFVMKCNHGCKWQYIIKDKNMFLSNKYMFDNIKQQMTGWLEQEYWVWGGFEMQYATSRRTESPDNILGAQVRLCKGNSLQQRSEANDLPERKGWQEKGIKPKILLEPFISEDLNTKPSKIQVYCFDGIPKIFIKFFNSNKMSIYNEKFEQLENIFNFSEENIKTKPDKITIKAVEISKKLSQDFIFVRVDWMLFKNKIYFEELTFTPYSGFTLFENKWGRAIGKWIKI